MASTLAGTGITGQRPDTLADALARSPLPLAQTLQIAVQIASQLRDLHVLDRPYGKVSALSIALTASGAELIPSRNYVEEPSRESDIRGWGGVLYEMLMGSKVPLEGPFPVPWPGGARRGPSSIRPAALRLAIRCLGLASATLPTAQQALSEIRLLALLTRQYSNPADTVERPPETSSPFLVSAAPAETVEPSAEEIPVLPPLPLDSFGQPAPKKPAEPAALEDGPCPRCDGHAIFISKPRSTFEHMLESWHIRICRCHRCYHRWVAFAHLKIAKALPSTSEGGQKVKARKK